MDGEFRSIWLNTKRVHIFVAMRIHFTLSIFFLSSFVQVPAWAITKITTAAKPGISVQFIISGQDLGSERLDFNVVGKSISKIKSDILQYKKIQNSTVESIFVEKGNPYSKEKLTKVDQLKNNDNVHIIVTIQDDHSPLSQQGSSFKLSEWKWYGLGAVILLFVGLLVWRFIEKVRSEKRKEKENIPSKLKRSAFKLLSR